MDIGNRVCHGFVLGVQTHDRLTKDFPDSRSDVHPGGILMDAALDTTRAGFMVEVCPHLEYVDFVLELIRYLKR